MIVWYWIPIISVIFGFIGFIWCLTKVNSYIMPILAFVLLFGGISFSIAFTLGHYF